MKNIYTISLIGYLLILSVFLVYTFTYNYIFSDEGTHFLLSVFYKDLISNLPQTGLSYENIYNFGINYLVHYPKLQIAYPPLYHLTNTIPFSIFGPSIFIARMVNLVYALLTFALFYILVKKYFKEKTAFISTMFFSASTYSLLYASRAFQDFSAYFFIMLSLLIFSKSIETQKIKYFLLLSITSTLSILSKQISVVVVLFFIIYTLYRKDIKKRFKNILLFLVLLTVLMTPYIAIMNVTGGLEINKIVAIGYASQQGEPTNLFDPMFWLYFLIQPIFFAPFSLVFIAILAIYIYKKEKYWKEFLIFFIVLYISISFIPNKELRFSQLFILPAYAVSGFYISKIKNKATIMSIMAVYFVVSLSIFFPTVQYYPDNNISEILYKNLPSGASISLLSDDEPLFSSSLMTGIRILDAERKIVILRSCSFSNKTNEDITKILDESNTYFIVYSEWSKDKTIHLINNSLEDPIKITENNMTTTIYKYKGFKNKKPEEICNYICLTGEKICSS